MAVDVSLYHRTHYIYDRLINLRPQIIRLKPAPHSKNPIHSYSLKLSPKKYFLNWQQDIYGNYLARLVVPEPVKELKIEVGIVTQISSFNPFEFFLEKDCQNYPFTYSDDLTEEIHPFLKKPQASPLLMKFIEKIDKRPRKIMDFLVDVNQMVFKELNYLIRLEPGVQSPEETLEKNSGSCRDFAWLLCAILRHFGFASRFVSGYLIQLKPDQPMLEGPECPKEDFADLHAWMEVFLPGAGWLGLDATSGLMAGEGHIPLVCTPKPSDAAPVSGFLDPCKAELSHSMLIERLNQDRRITKPFTSSEIIKIDELGFKVDEDLKQEGINLTMGGEPTFLPCDNLLSEEWSGQIGGTDKFSKAYGLITELKNSLAPQGIIHFGQGKWYPGEVLPRWSLNCLFRADNEVLLENSYLQHDLTKQVKKPQKLEEAKNLLLAFIKNLGFFQDNIISAYEAHDKKTAGFVCPLGFSEKNNGWQSQKWKTPDTGIILVPGDSPLGLRLPLAEIRALNPEPVEWLREADYLHPAGPLPKYKELEEKILKRSQKKSEEFFIGTALSVELREDKIFVFLPPTMLLEHYLELLVCLDLAAASQKTHYVLEGYCPPNDSRLKKFSVTPDPGVLEVNTLPAHSWGELKNSAESLYGCAAKIGLGASRFFLDGRRVGTQGGNHIVLGSERVEDSPFLKNPNLLRSMLSFWQHHPSLSYLFSSEFIGPTSQAPRIDEARNDSLYELEIAFKQLDQKSPMPFWLTDRLFRNLLVDPTGNTHRSEFCIDKMYSPNGPMGRLGLVELRAFEMPPHPQMALLQALLVRAALVFLHKKPFKQKLIRFGTSLHDQFMLPHYLWEDLLAVLQDFKEVGLNFDPNWFKAFLDFRFPVWGSTNLPGGLELELRHALEPWHVMGEDIYQGVVARAVDSSLERLQVKISGFDDRYLLLCNDYELPLKPCQAKGEYIAGVRFKAWQPPNGFHPTIKVHSPLVFDLVKKNQSFSLGGCKYHVFHPGGLSYERVPVNEKEAEARLRSRFDANSYSPGPIIIKQRENNLDFPHTLDLRQHE